VKKFLAAGIVLFGTWSCVTFAPSPPSFYIQDIPQSVSTRLTLDQRITADEAWANLKEGRADQARRLFLKLGQDNPIYAVGLGYVNLYLSDLDTAESDFKESLERFPDLTLANIGLAQVYEIRGQKDLVFSQYREVLKRDPENRWAKPRLEALRNELTQALFNEAGNAKAAGKMEEARTALLKVLFYDPDSPEANYLLGLIYFEENNIPSTLLHFSAFLDKGTGSGEQMRKVFRALAEIYYKRQELGRSLDCYEKLAELEPQDKAVAERIEELKNKLGIFELPNQYSLIPAQEAITREDLAALIAVKFKDFLNVPDQQTQILVDVSTSWAQKFIIKVASQNVMSVYDNHTFQPRRIINRADLAESLAGLIKFLGGRGIRFVPLLDTRRIQVADVSPDSFYYQPIIKVVAYQIMDLTPQRMFEPEKTVPGHEAIRILDIVLGLAKQPPGEGGQVPR
jgi:tetratricopeptide (TPR) repeat protein